jgi:glucan endo-1,3-alpha-glucosidase
MGNLGSGASLSSSSIPGGCEEDAESLRQYLEPVGRHPNQFLYQGRALVSTFAGDQCTFGQNSLTAGWNLARSALEHVCPVSPTLIRRTPRNTWNAHGSQIHLVPAFFIDPARYPLLSCIDGSFHVIGALI